jgi:membrane dipeptidase
MPLLFDSHLDLAWNALSWKRDLKRPLEEMNVIDRQVDGHPARGRATVSLPELRRAGVAVCLGTLMARVPYGRGTSVHGATLDFPAHENAYAFARGQLAYYQLLQTQDELILLRDAACLRLHWQRWETSSDRSQLPVGVILALEGCDAICDPAQAEHWFAAGLRCASLVHYGQSKYAAGTGEDGPLTPVGRELLRQFASLGIILDLSHLSDTSFFQALEEFQGPVMASHQNCRALVPGPRQFSDVQIRRLIQREGVLGIAFDAWMLLPGWQHGRTSRQLVSLEAAADQLDHICQLAGDSRHVGIGSDLDGGFGSEQTPRGLDTITDLQKLAAILDRRGYPPADVADIFGRTWLRFFAQHLPSDT